MTRIFKNLSPSFIAVQKAKLMALQQKLILNSDAPAMSGQIFHINPLPEPQGFGNEPLEMTERDHQAVHHDYHQRLSTIARALQKIEEGSYGLSDESGAPIAPAHLEATPESLLTVEEAARAEHA